jgi:hypothetical protein
VRPVVLATALSLLASTPLVGCTGDDDTPEGVSDPQDLPLGDVAADDLKADGDWGHALECKPIPDLPALPHP